MSDQAQSPLLRAVAALDEGVWGKYLLPKLIANRSACSFASSCQQLCRICRHNHKGLSLSDELLRNTWFEDGEHRLAQRLAHYPACSTITCEVGDDVSPACMTMHLLGRLCHITSLELRDLSTSPKLGLLNGVAVVINTARLELPAITHLSIFLDPWEGDWAGHTMAWAALGRATQLTSLCVGLPDEYNTFTMKHLSALQPLSTNLQQLIIYSGALLPSAEYSWLAALTSLTSLALPLASTQGLTSISSCSSLRSLRLSAENQDAEGNPVVLGEAEHAALEQLKDLRELHLPAVLSTNSCPPSFLSSLQQLIQLELSMCHDDAVGFSTAVAAVAAATQLQKVHLVVAGDSIRTGEALVRLSSLVLLTELEVQLSSMIRMDRTLWKQFFSGLHHVDDISVTHRYGFSADAAQAALKALRVAKQKRPAAVIFKGSTY